jgi:hypothetical protein
MLIVFMKEGVTAPQLREALDPIFGVEGQIDIRDRTTGGPGPRVALQYPRIPSDIYHAQKTGLVEAFIIEHPAGAQL